jgi:hypothetical protein
VFALQVATQVCAPVKVHSVHLACGSGRGRRKGGRGGPGAHVTVVGRREILQAMVDSSPGELSNIVVEKNEERT